MTWGRCHVIRSEARLPLHSHLLLPPPCRPFPGTVLGAPGRVFLKSIPLLCRLLTALGYVLTDSSSLISHFFLCILVLEKSDPHLLFWVSFLGKEDFSVRPRGWSPCPPPPPPSHSLPSASFLFVFPLFGLQRVHSKQQIFLSCGGQRCQEQTARSHGILCLFSLL